MAINESAELETVNRFQNAYQDFNNNRLFVRLKEKHRTKPYWEEHKRVKMAVLCTSYLFNVLSAFTASALVYSFLFSITDSETASFVVTGIVLFFLELLKRETASKLFHQWFQFRQLSIGMVISAILLSAISTMASYFGAENVVLNMTSKPEFRTYESASSIEAQISSIDEQLRNTTGNSRRTQRIKEGLTNTRLTLTNELLRVRQRVDDENDQISAKHTKVTEINSMAFAYITGCCELLLILAIYYLCYYDFRSFSEFAQISGKISLGNEKKLASGIQSPVYNHRTPIGFKYGSEIVTDVVTNVVTDDKHLRTCLHCQKRYTHNHSRQRYCSTYCRVTAWKQKTGRELFVNY